MADIRLHFFQVDLSVSVNKQCTSFHIVTYTYLLNFKYNIIFLKTKLQTSLNYISTRRPEDCARDVPKGLTNSY